MINVDLIPIIIINWNGIEDTKECVQSVLLQDYEHFEIHLIDNSSNNHEGNILSKLYINYKNIIVHLNDVNLGFAKAHNQWYQHIDKNKFKYIALLNNDTAVEHNWLSELVKAGNKHNAGMVSSKMINYYDRTIMDNAGHKMINTGEILPIGNGESILNYNIEFENMGACAGACLYNVELINHLGFFDPHFSTGYEDAEFGLRANIAKYKTIYCPKAIAYHKMGQSIKKIFNEKYSLMIQTSILYSYFKLMPLSKIILDIPSFIFKYISMIIIDIIFWRPKYLKIIFSSWRNIWNLKSSVLHARKKYFSTISDQLSLFQLFKKIDFFLWFDIKRFVKIFIRNKNSSLDSYTG